MFFLLFSDIRDCKARVLFDFVYLKCNRNLNELSQPDDFLAFEEAIMVI